MQRTLGYNGTTLRPDGEENARGIVQIIYGVVLKAVDMTTNKRSDYNSFSPPFPTESDAEDMRTMRKAMKAKEERYGEVRYKTDKTGKIEIWANKYLSNDKDELVVGIYNKDTYNIASVDIYLASDEEYEVLISSLELIISYGTDHLVELINELLTEEFDGLIDDRWLIIPQSADISADNHKLMITARVGIIDEGGIRPGGDIYRQVAKTTKVGKR